MYNTDNRLSEFKMTEHGSLSIVDSIYSIAIVWLLWYTGSCAICSASFIHSYIYF